MQQNSIWLALCLVGLHSELIHISNFELSIRFINLATRTISVASYKCQGCLTIHLAYCLNLPVKDKCVEPIG